MEYIIAGLMAAFSFLMNKLFIRNWGTAIIVGITPFVEETSKTLPAYYLGADIFAVHLIFGAIEGWHDFRNSAKKEVLAGLLSVAGHGMFGMITVLVFNFSSSVYIGLVAAVISHIFWNAAIIRLASRNENS